MNPHSMAQGRRRHARSAAPPWLRQRPVMATETLLLVVSVYFTVFSNGEFWRNVIVAPSVQWKLAVALFVIITALHALLLGLLIHRRYAHVALTVLILVTAIATYYMSSYGVYLDSDMLRNILHTDRKESRELLSWHLLIPLLFASLPIALLWRIQLRVRPWSRALLIRLGFLAGLVALSATAVMLCYPDLSSLIRNRREVRYLVTPANYLVSLTRTLTAAPPGTQPAKIPIGQDAKQAPGAAQQRPRLLVIMVGETVRAQNWGLNGYARQTTPELAGLNIINFPQVTACGSSTEVSLPCMFSPYGRHNYDPKRIRSHQSLLHVLEHAGIRTLWRDNQSGCKGVCEGLPMQALDNAQDPELCNGKRCWDQILLADLEAAIPAGPGDRVVVLHPLGNHGPNYFERYPPAFTRYTPVCQSIDLGSCEPQTIVNAYDNAIAYTDHLLAQLIARLDHNPHYDAALIYVSDHGESLGEKGLYLHGVPYAIAPEQQLRVPMVMWFSPGFTASAKLDIACLHRHSTEPASHDNLFSSVLGLLDVHTQLYDHNRDLFAPCRTHVAE